MSTFIDITNQRFGYLIAVERARKSGTQWMWRCQCDCGQEVIVRSSDLRSDATRSCGHIRRKRPNRLKHGQTKTREYIAWTNMKSRCYNPKNSMYKYYGGRGICVCESWENFENFFTDMGMCPPGHSIERIDVNGHYEPANCTWIPANEQSRNRRNVLSL
jgi:hypothetical protein